MTRVHTTQVPDRPTPLVDAALGSRAGEGGPERDRLEAVLREITDAASAAWPDVTLAAELFVRHLVSKLPGETVSEQALADLRAGDLYLACACAEGVPAALAAFDDRCLGVVDAAVARMDTARGFADEVKQVVRRLLLVSDGARRPRIAEYAGRGELRGWVRVVAAREALRLLRGDRREVPVEAALLDRAATDGEDPELRYLKEVYRGQFRAAFREAMASLTDRERNLLAHQFLDGLTLDDIASLYRVHRATVARWLARARKLLLRRTQGTLRARLRVDAEEMESIMRLIESRLDVTLPPLMREGE
jgi:RNA polymerase sigma-70 factor, ECF subfamily